MSLALFMPLPGPESGTSGGARWTVQAQTEQVKDCLLGRVGFCLDSRSLEAGSAVTDWPALHIATAARDRRLMLAVQTVAGN